MKLSKIYETLAASEVFTYELADEDGDILPRHRRRITTLINSGLSDLHQRFSIKEGVLDLEVTEDVLETIRAAERAEAAYDRRMYRYKANYSLDCDNGIENAILMKPQTPEMLLEEKQLREQLYAAVMALPEKQAKRIYARYYLGMRVSEIATAEGVDQSRVRDSIRRGLKQLAKYF